jgi:CheY-like chemotaxis protein
MKSCGDHQCRVLVVDDDEDQRSSMVEVLRDDGYSARSAVNGQDGIALTRLWRPDVILLDLEMPMMDGRAFRRTQRALRDCSAIPTVVVSGERRPSDLGSVGFVQKPYGNARLLDTVRRALPRTRKSSDL